MRWSKKQSKTVPGENSINLVSINSIQFNKNCSVITTNLKTKAGQNNIIVPYKVDEGSDGNIMPLQVYKKLFPEVINEHLPTSKNENILLKMYDKTTITQLGTCAVEVEH